MITPIPSYAVPALLQHMIKNSAPPTAGQEFKPFSPEANRTLLRLASPKPVTQTPYLPELPPPKPVTPQVAPQPQTGLVPTAGTLEGTGLTDTETAIKNQLMPMLTGGVSGLKDALFGRVKSRLDEDYRAQQEAIDRDMIRRGFGLSSGEGLNRLNAANLNRQRTLADAARESEIYGNQRLSDILSQAMGFAGTERGNEQSALDREYNDWLRLGTASQVPLQEAMNFAGLNAGTNTGIVGAGYDAYQKALGNQQQGYGNLGTWGAKTAQENWPAILRLINSSGNGSGYQAYTDYQPYTGYYRGVN